MSNEFAITVDGASLSYPIFEKVDFDETKTSSLGGNIEKIKGRLYMKALDNVSFRIKKGERVGILGHNGAGKSTLLRAIAGIYKPQTGKVIVDGTISAVFDKMLGMDQELTGKENIYGRGVFLGKSKAEVDAVYQDILSFTELEQHICMPIKYYSPGMKARLGFAISTAFEADILLLDEWLGVGDASFQAKAQQRMATFVSSAGTVILASHNAKLIEQNCDRVLTFSKGKII